MGDNHTTVIFALRRLFLIAMTLGIAAETQGRQFNVRPTKQGVAVTIDGAPFADYLTRSGHQPVIWPIISPGGQVMTRQYPLGERLPTESADHPHHRSLWFNHGSVNGLDFWAEPNHDVPDGSAPADDNRIEHVEFVDLKSGGDAARIVATNRWLANGRQVCEDERTILFGADRHGRWIDFAVWLKASNGDLTLGDTKEGAFGLRVPGTMAVDARQGGEIRNSRGQRNADAWGRAALWVDYHGVVDDKPAGIVVFDMPDSFRHPTRWHVRTYGLFAANPFGQRDFPPDEGKQGEVVVPAGERLRLHYRILFYDGELSMDEIDEIYRKYTTD